MATLPTLEIATLFQTREVVLGRGLAVLATWALLNLVVSGYWVRSADRRQEAYFFHGMNVSWGAINTGLACWGVLHLQFVAPAGFRLADLVQTQLFNENLFLLNAGLDAAYIMTGFYLRAQAAAPGHPNPVRPLGFGRALWIQGGFLLVFDTVMWSLLHWQGRSWLPLLA